MTTFDDDDRVGYCRPPKHSRFKKGQSGNPRGRRRPHPYGEAENPLRMYMLEEMTVKVQGKKVRMPAIDVIIKSIINKAAAGDHRSQKLLIQESGGLTAIREEYKRALNSADRALIEEARKEVDEWPRESVQARDPENDDKR
jgi:hypothetical protein